MLFLDTFAVEEDLDRLGGSSGAAVAFLGWFFTSDDRFRDASTRAHGDGVGTDRSALFAFQVEGDVAVVVEFETAAGFILFLEVASLNAAVIRSDDVFSWAVFKEDLPGAEALSVDVFGTLFASTLDALVADWAPFVTNVLFSTSRISTRKWDAFTAAFTGLWDPAVASWAIGTALGGADHLVLTLLVWLSWAAASGTWVGLLAVSLAWFNPNAVNLAVILWFTDPVEVSAGRTADARNWSVNWVFTFWVALFEWGLSVTRTRVVVVTALSIVWAVGGHGHAIWASAADDLRIVGFAGLGSGFDALVGWTFASQVWAAAVRFKNLTFVWTASSSG